MREHRDQMKPEAIWNIESGLKLSAEDVARAMVKQGDALPPHERLHGAIRRLRLRRQPGPALPDRPRLAARDRRRADGDLHRLDEVRLLHHLDPMPAISVPAGFTPDGLPVGIQIVGKYQGDLELLKIANAFEQATNVASKRPPIVS